MDLPSRIYSNLAGEDVYVMGLYIALAVVTTNLADGIWEYIWDKNE